MMWYYRAMKSINKLKDNLLHLNRLRKFVGFNTMFMAIKSELKLTVIDSVTPKRILVLSPHPDDDVFGCGGTLRLHQQAGSKITVLNLTNGKNASRVAESSMACRQIGVEDVRCWDYLDSELQANRKTVSMLIKLIAEIKPEIIFVPSFFDSNNDHTETTKILAKALAKDHFSGDIYSYEIWQPLFANRLVTIDSVIEDKKKAIESHQSQLKDRSYQTAILGLNQYRAGMFGAGQYAEAFFTCKKELYLTRSKLVNP